MGIQAWNLRKSLGEPPQPIIRGVDLDILDGEFISITGRSGSGKSTLLYLISSLDRPTSGQILIDGIEIEKISKENLHRFRNEKMGFIFQSHHLLPELTALENVLMPARRTHAEKIRKERALNLLKEFGLEARSHHRPGQMSGGEQQRVAIARSLIMEPRFLFADEPTGNLDSANGDRVLSILRGISKNLGTTIVMVTHDPEYAALASRTIHLVDGEVS